MSEYEELVNRANVMMSLFQGLHSAHGIFEPGSLDDKGKLQGRFSTVREPITVKLWVSHLKGENGLGIIPINEQSKCKWGVIDVDDYSLDWVELLNSISSLPFVVCRSKSGGVHLFLFLEEETNCKIVRDYLRNVVGLLGLGRTDIFPKQDKTLADRGDVGNWLNMPYYGNNRKCIILEGGEIKELEIQEFTRLAYKKKINPSFFKTAKEIDYDASPIEQGPPCLQIMSLKGFPPHTRNVSLFNIGVYAKKATPDQWKLMVRQFNRVLFKDHPLTEREVDDIIKSLDKKTYSYQCYQEPLCSFCNAKLCRTRKYGISTVVGLPIVNSVTKITGDLSMFFLDVEGGRLELTAEELYDNRRFNIKCLNDLNILPSPMKMEQWAAFIQSLLDQSVEIRDESMFSRQEIPQMFQQFIVTRLSKNLGDLDANRTYYDPNEMEIRFKFDAFTNFLRFRKIDINKGAIVMYFKMRGSRSSTTKDKMRRSIRFIAVRLTDEEIASVQERQKKEDVLS